MPALARGLEARGLVAVTAVLLALASLALVARASAHSWRSIRMGPWVAIGTLGAATWAIACQKPVEGVHIVQYGGLALLATRALQGALGRVPAYGASLLLTVCVSWTSEMLQAIAPGRVYDLRDVLLDGLSGMLGLMAAWQIER